MLCSPGACPMRLGTPRRSIVTPVVLEEVDRLVDVADRLAPCLAGLERHQRGEFHRLGAHQLGRPEEHGRAGGRRSIAPPRDRRPRRGDCCFGLGAAAVGDHADDVRRSSRIDRLERPGSLYVAPSDAQRMAGAEASAYGRERRIVGVPVLSAGEVGVRLVVERPGVARIRGRDGGQPPWLGAEVGGRLRRPDQLLDGGTLYEGLTQEGLVGRVLEQTPDQVRHAWDELAHGCVLAQAQAHAADGGLHRLTHAVQHLDLEGAGRQLQLARRLDRHGQRAHVVTGECRAQVVRGAEHLTREPLVHRVAVRLVREHRDRPPFLGGDDRLVVPVGALHQTQSEDDDRESRAQSSSLARSRSASRRYAWSTTPASL